MKEFPQHIISRLNALEASALLLANEARNAKNEIERFYSLPPKVKKETGLTAAEIAQFKARLLKTALNKKAVARNTGNYDGCD